MIEFNICYINTFLIYAPFRYMYNTRSTPSTPAYIGCASNILTSYPMHLMDSCFHHLRGVHTFRLPNVNVSLSLIQYPCPPSPPANGGGTGIILTPCTPCSCFRWSRVLVSSFLMWAALPEEAVKLSMSQQIIFCQLIRFAGLTNFGET